MTILRLISSMGALSFSMKKLGCNSKVFAIRFLNRIMACKETFFKESKQVLSCEKLYHYVKETENYI